MCEPLRNKVKEVDTKFYENKPQRGVTTVEVFLKKDVKFAIEFYLKYKTQYGEFTDRAIARLKRDHPPSYSAWISYNEYNDDYDYDDWLLKYAFTDCIEGK